MDASRDTPSANLPNKSWRRDIFLLTLALSIFFGWALGQRALWHPDEGRYVEIPREMVQSGDYVTPRLNGVKYFEKPVLFYWLQAGAIKVFGLKEWSMRLWSAIFAIIGCLATYAAGRQLYDRRTGLLACAVLATTPLYYILGRTITLDMTVSVLLTLALFAFLLGTRRAPGAARRNYFWAFYILAALATLTKGLIGIVIPALVIGAWIVILNEWRLLKSIYLPSGLILFLLVAAPWHILAARANPEFAQFYFIHEHFQRYLSKVHDRYQPPWFFVPVLLAGFFPWTAYLVQAFSKAWPLSWRACGENRETLFLLLWAVLPFIFFSLSDSKLIPYIVPILPPLALLTARYLNLHFDLASSRSIRAGTWLLLALAVMLALALIWLPENAPDRPRVAEYSQVFGRYTWLILGSLMACAIIPFGLSFLRRPAWTLGAMAISALIFLRVIDHGFSFLDDKRSVKSLALTIKSRLQAGDEVMTYQEYYQDLPVYLERRITIVNWLGELRFGSEVEDTHAWLIDEATFWQRWQNSHRVYLLTGRDNYDKLRAQGRGQLHLLAQTGSNVLLTNRTDQP
ncbi:MAG: glycosyltransferase family 39 protein [Gammaproteobacteria bacterium]|nr:glycosyltransferase family 39 protein [Gammaproteobacteria bacterium]